MYYPDEKIKVNKFHEVAIPSNAEYFARYGMAVCPSSQYTGDELAPSPMNKTEMFKDMEAYDRMMQEKESSKSE